MKKKFQRSALQLGLTAIALFVFALVITWRGGTVFYFPYIAAIALGAATTFFWLSREPLYMGFLPKEQAELRAELDEMRELSNKAKKFLAEQQPQ